MDWNRNQILSQQPFDIFHDNFKGVAVDVISNATKYLIVEGFLALEYVNNQIQNFDYKDQEKSDKPQQLSKPWSWSDFKKKQNAVEIHNLLIRFPFYLAAKFHKIFNIGKFSCLFFLLWSFCVHLHINVEKLYIWEIALKCS